MSNAIKLGAGVLEPFLLYVGDLQYFFCYQQKAQGSSWWDGLF